MPTIYECMTAVLLTLDDPRAACPGDAQLLNQICVQTRTVLRAKRNSSNPWNYADIPIETQPDEALYQITASDFGLPLAVITQDDYANPAFVCRRIPFYTSADFSTMENSLPQGAGQWYTASTLSSGDPNHVALRCSITWRNNLPYIEFFPVGNMQATYKIRYLQNASGVQDMALTATPVPAEDSDLVILRAAKSLLHAAKWEGNNEAANELKRKNLMVSLAADEQLAREQFDAANLVTTGIGVRPRWNPTV